MGRVLLYPMLALFALIPLGTGVWAFTALVQGWREARAVREARWESYIEDIGGGKAEVGIQLVARWGLRHQRILHRSDHPTEVPANDMEAIFQAQFDAGVHADANNQLRVSARNWPMSVRATDL
jgi:hypothetical protein